MWEMVQAEFQRREKLGAKYSATSIFSSKLICGDCGGFYGKRYGIRVMFGEKKYIVAIKSTQKVHKNVKHHH